MTDQIAVMIFSGLVTVGGALWFAQSFRDRRVQRLIQDTPTARIRSMAMGMVELSGHTVARSMVNAPFSGRPCVYWEVEISTRRTGKHHRGWNIVHRNRSGSPFFLKDDTGLALVYPQGADCRLPFGVEEVTGGFGVPEVYSEYMRSQNLGMAGFWSLGSMRFRERTLDESQVVFVLGRAHPRSRAVSLGDDDVQVMQGTGTDGLRTQRLASLDAEVRGVIRKDANDPVLLISPSSERNVATEYMLRAMAGTVLGPALALGGLAFLLWLASQR